MIIRQLLSNFFDHMKGFKHSPRAWRVALHVLFGIFIMVWLSMMANGQTELRLNDKVLACDDGVSLQDLAVGEAFKNLGKDAVLFVVIRPSRGEDTKELSAKRIYNVEQYFRDRGSRMESQRVLVTLGPSVEGNARLEYYINGEIFVRLIYPDKGFICHSCCGPDPAYYPHKKGSNNIRLRK